MEFFGLNRKSIKSNSVEGKDFYAYKLGEKIEITATKKSNSNTILSSSLSEEKREDKMMIKYHPSNIIFFDKDFIDSESSNLVSCYIDSSSYSVFIGKEGKYEMNTGVLLFSGVLSLNNLVQKQRVIFTNSQLSDSTTKSKIKLLSVGLLNKSLFGLYYVPKTRGIAIGLDDSDNLAFSTKTWKLQDFSNWDKYTIDDWFYRNKVQKVYKEDIK